MYTSTPINKGIENNENKARIIGQLSLWTLQSYSYANVYKTISAKIFPLF